MSCVLLLLLRSLRVEIENRLNALGGEFRRQPRGFFAAELPVAAAHFVGKTIAIRNREADVFFREHRLERLPVLRPGIA